MGDDCVEAYRVLYQYLDGELTVERRVAIARHLDDCPPCGGGFHFEAELRTIVAKKCQEQVPDHVRQRVLDAIRELTQ